MSTDKKSASTRHFTIHSATLWTRVNDNIVTLQQETGRYHGLNEVGSTAFATFAEGSSFGEVHAALLELYEVDSDILWNDLLLLVDRLVELRLLAERTTE